MDKKIYAIKVAEGVKGRVTETEKGIAIAVPEKIANIEALFYVDNFFKDHSVNQAIDHINHIIYYKGEIYMNYDITNYDEVKHYLKACLVGEQSLKDEYYRQEAANGFDDLFIIFKLENIISGDTVPYNTITVTTEMIHSWGIDSSVLLYDAMQNVEYTLQPLMNVLASMLNSEPEKFESPIWIATTTEKTPKYGAIAAIILAPMLKDKFPNGYIVIPSSIHEVLIISKEYATLLDVNEMVSQVNNDCLDAKNILSNHAYEF